MIIFQLLVMSSQSDEAKGVLFALSMMPLLWGDSFGEIVGSFFGKRTFQVPYSTFLRSDRKKLLIFRKLATL